MEQKNIQDFWSGESFYSSTEASRLSYQLAQLMVKAMSHEYDYFVPFVNHAGCLDSGEGAAKHFLGGSLGDYLVGLLGEGEWSPCLTA